MKTKANARGFGIAQFKDRNKVECSIQKSSLATEDCIWLGVNDADPQIMVSQAAQLGIQTKETSGWIPYPVPKEVLFNTRMHLTRKQVKDLLPLLQKFVETGEI